MYTLYYHPLLQASLDQTPFILNVIFYILRDFFVRIVESKTVCALLLLFYPHLLLCFLSMRTHVILLRMSIDISLHDVALLEYARKNGDVLVGEILRSRARQLYNSLTGS